jgi:hypothetical protein
MLTLAGSGTLTVEPTTPAPRTGFVGDINVLLNGKVVYFIPAPEEEWRDIPGYEGYQASSWGRIRSTDREVIASNGQLRRYRGQILSPMSNGKGYLLVSMGGKKRKVHSLVTAAFLGPRPDGLDVCHGPRGKQVNAPTNLRYDTRSANILDSVADGTHGMTRRTHCPQGHPLVAPNLVQGARKRGARHCLACNRAHAAQSKAKLAGVTLDFQAVSDEKYAAILAEARTARFLPPLTPAELDQLRAQANEESELVFNAIMADEIDRTERDWR